jgi:hypothetical protein
MNRELRERVRSAVWWMDGEELHGGWIGHVWARPRLRRIATLSRVGSGSRRSERDGGGGAGEKRWRHVGEEEKEGRRGH